MAETGKTPYIVLREIDTGAGDGDLTIPGGEIPAGSRLFVTDETVIEATSGDAACRQAAEKLDSPGVYGTVPERSWDPAQYEIDRKPTARRVNASQAALDV